MLNKRDKNIVDAKSYPKVQNLSLGQEQEVQPVGCCIDGYTLSQVCSVAGAYSVASQHCCACLT
jgi:hypothetical protein